jgi:hypothetical protein
LFSNSKISYTEDGIEICKPCYFEIFNYISYIKENKEFLLINNISSEMKNLLKMAGLKKIFQK